MTEPNLLCPQWAHRQVDGCCWRTHWAAAAAALVLLAAACLSFELLLGYVGENGVPFLKAKESAFSVHPERPPVTLFPDIHTLPHLVGYLFNYSQQVCYNKLFSYV